jgi:glycerol uptake facilitator-like aquaporin
MGPSTVIKTISPAPVARVFPRRAMASFPAAKRSPTFGLVAAILGSLRFRADATPWIVGLYITSAYWFTASTSFANPAVTLARGLSDTFAGIAPLSAPLFVLAQLCGAVAATLGTGWLFAKPLTSPTSA